jgi:hypothetical protein
MGVPFEVTFQEMWPTDEVMAIVRQRVEGLRTTYGEIDRCRVVIDRPRRRKGKGRKFRVAIDVAVGGEAEFPSVTATTEHVRLITALSKAFHAIGPRVGASPDRCRAHSERADLRQAA